MARKNYNSSKTARLSVPYIAISRPWLIALVAVMIVPWLTVSAIWLKPMSRISMDTHDSDSKTSLSSGKWGNLTLSPTVISPPMELVFTDWGFHREPTWYFPGLNADRVAQILQSAGVSAADAGQLRVEAKFEPQSNGVILRPDPAWVRALSPEIRSRIYRMLAKSELNVDQAMACRYLGSNLEDWLSPDLISQHTLQLVKPLIYRDCGYMLFSDLELVRSEIGSRP